MKNFSVPVNTTVDVEHFNNLWRLSRDGNQINLNENVHVVYVFTNANNWVRREQFVEDFLKIPITEKIVIHTVFEGFSMTALGILECIDQLVNQQQRNPNTVKIFSPNSIVEDCHYENLFFYEYNYCDEFATIKYIVPSVNIEIDSQLKTWALFVGKKSMPRLMALYELSTDDNLKNQVLLSAMIESTPWITPIWYDPARLTEENLNRWLPAENTKQRIRIQGKFTHWFRYFPITSIDGITTNDQYDSLGTRPASHVLSLLNFRKQFLFELVFETMTTGLCFMPTEKTLRAIVAEKPMLVYAAPNFLYNLKKLGFKTFDTLWDESYDTLEGPDRYRAMMEIVRSVGAMPCEKQLELYNQSRDICQYNRKRLIYLNRPKNARYQPG